VALMTPEEAERLAAALDLDVDELGICHACLCIVSFAIDSGDEREIRLATNRIARDLWAEGLALPAQAALERARKRGVPGAEAAIAEVEAKGHRTRVVHAIVRCLAAELLRRGRAFGDPGSGPAPVFELPPRPSP
jgi:hypothetical protein